MSKLIGKMAKCQISTSDTGTYEDLWDVAQDVTLDLGVNTFTINRKKASNGWQGVLLGDFVLNSFTVPIDYDETSQAMSMLSTAFWGKSIIFAKVYYTETKYIKGQFYVTRLPLSQPLEDAVQGEVEFGLVDGTIISKGEDAATPST